MKILHLTHHSGCQLSLDFVGKSLGHEVVTMPEVWGWNYNVGHDRAETLWNQHKDYFNQFDLIITSDTAPLSRIFLQNAHWNKKLIVWVCNRWNYADSRTLDCEFPDQEFHQLFQPSKNTKIFSYTKFEYEYAQNFCKKNWGNQIIKPCIEVSAQNDFISNFPSNVNKSDTFFIPPYHNDTIFMNLKQKCDSLGIETYNGRYNGPQDLMGIKGIIHIPYGWSFLSIFENFALGNVYLIPSKDFLLRLSKQPNFWWQDAYALDRFITSAEFYLPEHKDLFIYFNDWVDLQRLSKQESLLQEKKQLVSQFSKKHVMDVLNQWQTALNDW